MRRKKPQLVFMTESQKSYYHMSFLFTRSEATVEEEWFPLLTGRSIKEFLAII